jgi:hypothetical protein
MKSISEMCWLAPPLGTSVPWAQHLLAVVRHSGLGEWLEHLEVVVVVLDRLKRLDGRAMFAVRQSLPPLRNCLGCYEGPQI